MATSSHPGAEINISIPPVVAVEHAFDHLVHFYGEDAFLIDELGRFIGGALVAGHAAVVIATKAHREALNRRLKSSGFDVAAAVATGRYVLLDAAETLTKFVVNGHPDPQLFARTISPVLAKAAAASDNPQAPVSAFGEMVALLWAAGNTEATIALERCWNDLAQTHPLRLRCGYPLAKFSHAEHSQAFGQICREHSAVIPVESYSGLTEEMRVREVAELQQKAQALETERALRKSELPFRLLVEAAQDYAIFLLDPQGHVISWNVGAQRIKGYKPGEIIGRHFSVFYPEGDVAAGKPARELETAARDGRVEDEGWRVRKDGSRFWANVIITALREANGNLIGFGKVTRDFTDRVRSFNELQAARQKLEDSEASLRHLSGRLLRTQDEERRRIGRDLHDSLGQYLTALKMKVASLQMELSEGHTMIDAQRKEAFKQDLADCRDLAEQSIREVRTVSYLLYPPMLEELGLASAIGWYLEGFSSRSGIDVSCEIASDLGRLDRDVELALFRVL